MIAVTKYKLLNKKNISLEEINKELEGGDKILLSDFIFLAKKYPKKFNANYVFSLYYFSDKSGLIIYSTESYGFIFKVIKPEEVSFIIEKLNLFKVKKIRNKSKRKFKIIYNKIRKNFGIRNN